MKIIKHIMLITLILGVYTNLFATDYYPIVAIHGIQNDATAKKGWPDWNNVNSAIKKIRKETYRGYAWGLTLTGKHSDSCWANTELQPMPDTRRIYNFSYYNPGTADRGVIGSNGKYEPVRYTYEYTVSNANRQYGYLLAQFIHKVLRACYGDNWESNPDAKVNIVAHSMGGLVARSAITYYLEPNRVNKLLLIASPRQVQKSV